LGEFITRIRVQLRRISPGMFPLIYTTVLIYWLALCANPIIESMGFTPDAPGKTLPSQTKRPFTPYTS